jgi:hypothetical protein
MQVRGYGPGMRHDRIIDLFGGNTALAKLVGRSDSAISRWRDNGIPPRFWPLILDLADGHGFEEITIDELRAGHRIARRARVWA